MALLETFFYYIAKAFVLMYFFVFHRVRIRGAGDLRKFLYAGGGPVIVASNHESYLDPPLVGSAFPGRLRSIAWDGLFKSRVFSWLISALGAIPVSHEDKSSAASLIRRVIGLVKDGTNVLIFPEGRRSTDGELGKLEGGAAMIALRTAVPIVPVWIEGTFEALPAHRTWPRPERVTITFGRPISTDEMPPEMSEQEKRAYLMERLEQALRDMRDELSGSDESGSTSDEELSDE